MNSGFRRRWMIAMATVLGVLFLPAVAGAATAEVTGSTLTFTAASGEENELFMETASGVFRVTDAIAPVTAGTGCNQRSLHRVNCPTGTINLVVVQAKDGDDVVQVMIGTVDANIDGGSGGDFLQSGEGDDTLTLGSTDINVAESATAGGGEDTLIGATTPQASDFLGGEAGDDELIGGVAFDSMFGGTGADDIVGGGSNGDFVSFSGTAGVDVTLDNVANDGEPGENDNVHDDIEVIFGTTFADTMVGSTGGESLFAFEGQDDLQAGPGDDTMNGGDGADTLAGQDGDDTMQGGNDADDISGGAGIDQADYQDHSSQVTVTINNVANDGSGGGAEGDNVRTDVENLTGGPNNDTLTGSTSDNRILGVAGNDTIMGIGGDDSLFGDFQFGNATGGDDTLNGGNGDDTMSGGAGGDHIIGNADYDFVDYQNFAGTSDLTITADNVANDGAGGEGDNVDPNVEGITGGNGNDNITGSGVANTLRGGGGADTLNGTSGDDTLQGDRGCCTYSPDIFIGGAGTDTVTYRDHSSPVFVDIDGIADDGLGPGTENDNVQTTVENVIGGSSSDTITGSNAANAISGRDGADHLIGGGGGDHLTGGTSADTLEGEAGKDELNSRGDNSSDTDNCGTEGDVAIVDLFDVVNPDCETLVS